MIPLTKQLVEERADFLKSLLDQKHGESEELFRHLDCDICGRTINIETEEVDGWITEGNFITGWKDICPKCQE